MFFNVLYFFLSRSESRAVGKLNKWHELKSLIKGLREVLFKVSRGKSDVCRRKRIVLDVQSLRRYDQFKRRSCFPFSTFSIVSFKLPFLFCFIIIIIFWGGDGGISFLMLNPANTTGWYRAKRKQKKFKDRSVTSPWVGRNCYQIGNKKC